MASSYGTLINSLNLFVDTSDPVHKGDDINLQLQGQALHAQDGQNFKVVLTEFNMQRPTYTIDGNNSAFSYRRKLNGVSSFEAEQDEIMATQNFASVQEIAQNFAEKLKDSLVVDIIAETGIGGITGAINVTSPAVNESPEKTGTLKLDVTITFSNVHEMQDLLIQLDEADGDSYLILGGDRVTKGSTSNSMIVTIPSTTSIRIQGRYPMQLTSLPHLYVRTDLQNTAIQSSSLNGALGSTSTHTISSNILAKIPMSFGQINYAAPGIDEFFIYLSQRHIPSIRLHLTDHKGRVLGRGGPNASINGSMHFTATLRIDTVQRTPPNTLKTNPIPRTIPGSRLGPQFVTNELLRED